MRKHPLTQRLALLIVACFTWSFVLSITAQAMSWHSPVSPGRTRALSSQEMKRIIGASMVINPDPTGGDSGAGGGAAAASSPGPTQSWVGTVGNVATATGNKVTSIPIVGWRCRGGMSVAFNFVHASESNRGGSLGPKWSFSYFSSLAAFTDGSGNVQAYWGNQSAYTFVRNVNGSYTPPHGIHEVLIANGSPVTSYDLYSKDQVRYHFIRNAAYASNYYFLSTISDENGNTINVNQDAATGKYTSIVDPTGRTLQLNYSNGQLTSITDPLNRVWSLAYDGNGRIAQIHPPQLNGDCWIQLQYDANNNISDQSDYMGNWAHAGYNSDGSTASIQDPCGNRTNFSYASGSTNGSGTTTITDPNGHKVVHTYSGGRLVSVMDSLNTTEYYQYDNDNNRTQVQDKRGNIWKYTFDSQGNVLVATNPFNKSSTFSYNGHNRLLTATDALQHTVQRTYDSSDNLINVVDALNHTSTLGYYQYGQPTTVTDALSNTTHLAYDNNGYLRLVTDANGNTAQANYNYLGWKMWSQDGIQQQTSFTHDAWGRVTAVTAPDGTVGTAEYDVDSRVVSVNGGYNRPYSLRCGQGAGDGWGADGWYQGNVAYASTANAIDTRLVSNPAPQSVYQSERNGADFTYSLPNLYPGRLYTVRLHFAEADNYRPGDRVFSISINGQTVLPNFDIVAAAGTANRAVIREFAVKADGNGFLTIRFQHVSGGDPNAKVNGIEIICRGVSNSYDAEGRLLQSANGRGDTITNTYDQADANGNSQKGLLSWTADGDGHTTRYVYTARNALDTVSYADGTSEHYGYDGNGNANSYRRPDGSTIQHVYDIANRLTNVNYPHPSVTPNVTFGYDDAGRTTSMADGIGTTQWAYDAANRPTQLSTPYNSVSYAYYNNNWRQSMTEGSNGTWSYQYDAGGRLTSLANPFNETTSFTYDADNRPTQQTNAWGHTTAWGYDSRSRLLRVLWGVSNNSTADGWDDYAYDAASNLIQKTANDGGTTNYGYDGTSKITWEQRTGGNPAIPAYSEAYTYDHNNNRLTRTLNGQTDAYSYLANSDKLQSINGGISGSRTYQYDANGAVSQISQNGQTHTFTLDDAERPVRQDFGNGVYSSYAYNGMNQRVFYHDADGLNHYNSYDGASPGAALLSDSTRVYTPGISEHRNTDNTSYYYLQDRMGSLRCLYSGATGQMSDDSRFDGFGLPVYQQNAPTTSLAWGGGAGYQSDWRGGGVLLMGNRYYDPNAGRFLSQDPAGAGRNWYAYCANNPTGGQDPTGLDEAPAAGPGQQPEPNWPNGSTNYPPGTTYKGTYVGDDGNWHIGSPPSTSGPGDSGGGSPSGDSGGGGDAGGGGDSGGGGSPSGGDGGGAGQASPDPGFSPVLTGVAITAGLIGLGILTGGIGDVIVAAGVAAEGAAEVGAADAAAEVAASEIASGAGDTATTFASDDPGVADLANEINARYPGHVVGVNQEVEGQEVDILLKNSIIEVKGGNGAGLTRQIIARQGLGLPVIGYAPGMGAAASSINAAGGIAAGGSASTLETLLQVVAP